MAQRTQHRFDPEKELRKALRYYRNGQFRKAEKIYRRVAKSHPTHQSYANLGAALQAQGYFERAIECYEKSLNLKPDYADAHFSMGSTFHAQARLEDALSCYQKAIEFKPDYAAVYNNMGILFQEQDKLDEAIRCYQRALELRPDFPVALNSMGTALDKQGKLEEAISCFEKALQLRPDYPQALINLLDQLEQTCSWNSVGRASVKLDNLTKKAVKKGIKPAETPFHSLNRHMDAKRQFVVAKLHSADIEWQVSKVRRDFSFGDRKSVKDRITVGYLSNDFNEHPTAHLMLSLFEMHNRNEFQIMCYSYGIDDGSYYKKRIEQDSDRFVDVRHMSYIDAARCIYEDRVDILVELKGYTKGARLEICALRPAPVQVSYLGFPGTTGANFIDYIISDKLVAPDDHRSYYSEKLVHLPHCYQVNDCNQTIASKEWKKGDFGLHDTSFVFASFNQGYKIEPLMFSTWMKILKHVPESVMWLLRGNDIAERNLKRAAEERQVNADRLIFADKLPKDEHLARLKLADLVLDTRIYNGHTTTSDALWAGVPVITMQGTHFASRVSSSILTAIGLPELITPNLDEYEHLSVCLASNPDQLQTICQKLTNNRLVEPLFDTPRFARNLEKAYKEMWDIFLAGERPRQIAVVEN